MNTDVYAIRTPAALLGGNPYVGRGIVCGTGADGKNAVFAYFIMGRSANSRNRVFAERGEELITRPFDDSRVEDPSLIIYSAVRRFENKLIVTNGDQTDTIYEYLAAGKSFQQALETRCFEPDGPNFTPRISALLTFGESFSYEMSILKSIDERGSACQRQFFRYPSLPGLGHFLHTYVTDGSPIPSFAGEPERMAVSGDIDAFTKALWENLDKDNRISLYVRYIPLDGGAGESRLINKNQR